MAEPCTAVDAAYRRAYRYRGYRYTAPQHVGGVIALDTVRSGIDYGRLPRLSDAMAESHHTPFWLSRLNDRSPNSSTRNTNTESRTGA